jgi:hypothetical protein
MVADLVATTSASQPNVSNHSHCLRDQGSMLGVRARFEIASDRLGRAKPC